MKVFKKVRIEILPEGRLLFAHKGENLLNLLLLNEVLTKGQDAVRLERGSVSSSVEPELEKTSFSPTEQTDGWMLASRRNIEGNAVFYVPQAAAEPENEQLNENLTDTPTQLVGLAMAVDLGSGTVAAGMSALPALAIPTISACVSSQCELLGDMGARLKFIREEEEGLEKLQHLLYEDIKHLTLRLSDKTGLDPAQVRMIMVAANTSIGQMLWGEYPGSRTGVVASWRSPQKRPTQETPLASLMPQAEIVLMPAAYDDIGSDIVSAALAAGLRKRINEQQITLLIDLGLSTEIVAAGRGRLLAVSVSTPALE
ncbi:MAG: hypothetical protein FWG61_05880, partial [Firmicutes bacterium]|nr:hypothetical protein [Bacillota bacterium]